MGLVSVGPDLRYPGKHFLSVHLLSFSLLVRRHVDFLRVLFKGYL